MLAYLRIANYALIDDLAVEFGEGLNLVTGETGSGKSIIVDSVSALTGERVSSDLIREGSERATVEGVFELPSDPVLSEELESAGIRIQDKATAEIVVRREFSASGRNRVYINDRIVTLGFLKAIAPYLSDIHGQGENAALFRRASHLEILDLFARVVSEKELVARKAEELRAVSSELRDLQNDEASRLQLVDTLGFQTDEIRRADISEGEEEELESEKRLLNNAGKLAELSSECLGLLYDRDDSLLSGLASARARMNELGDFEPKFSSYDEDLESAYAVIEDAAFALREFSGTLEYSPERLEEIENRLAEIARLKRKYGGTVAAVIAHLEDTTRRLANIESSQDRERDLLGREASLREEYLALAEDLSEKRRKAASRFERKVQKQLKTLALEKAVFRVRIESLSEVSNEETIEVQSMKANGIDTVEFFFSANPGESPKELRKVASGGEASRLALVLKTATNAGAINTAVFDEIDSGIGGRVAESVGLLLKDLAGKQQVLCVTHQPQIASLADHHFVVEKVSERNRTRVGIRELSDDEKVSEIARMLAGETVSETARDHASEMLKATH